MAMKLRKARRRAYIRTMAAAARPIGGGCFKVKIELHTLPLRLYGLEALWALTR